MKNLLPKYPLALFSVFFVLFLSCTKDSSASLADPNWKEIKTYSIQETKAFLTSAQVLAAQNNFNLDVLHIQQKITYVVKAYKIIYNTSNYDGKNIAVSGIVLVPQNCKQHKLAMVLHGTVDDKNKTNAGAVPSLLNENSSPNFEIIQAVLFASLGMVVFVPDYIGYGASINVAHPYLHKKTLASSSIDMLKVFLTNYYINFSDLTLSPQLYIVGYSEGGMSALAVQESLEKNPIVYKNQNIEIASCVAGGPISDVSKFSDSVFSKNQSLPFLPTYLWVVSSYNTIYNLNLNKNDVFSHQYTNTITSFDDFAYAKFSTLLPTNPKVLLNASFLDDYLNKTPAAQKLRDAIIDNNLNNWVPQNKLTIVHGQNDDYVYPFQSQSTYTLMTQKGAKNVILILTPNTNHFTTALTSYLQAILDEVVYTTSLN